MRRCDHNGFRIEFNRCVDQGVVWSYLYAIAALAAPARWMTFVSRKPA